MRPSGARCSTGSPARAPAGRIAAMKRLALALALVAVTGCTSLTIGPKGVEAHGSTNSNAIATVIVVGYLVGAAIDDARDPRPFPSLSHSFSEWTRYEPAPPLAADRRVVEQDCSKPPVDPYANLRCR